MRLPPPNRGKIKSLLEQFDLGVAIVNEQPVETELNYLEYELNFNKSLKIEASTNNEHSNKKMWEQAFKNVQARPEEESFNVD
jgi:hypothetical protein